MVAVVTRNYSQLPSVETGLFMESPKSKEDLKREKVIRFIDLLLREYDITVFELEAYRKYDHNGCLDCY